MKTTNKLLSSNQIRLNQSVSSQQEVFDLIGRMAVEAKIASSAALVAEGLKQRELESTTGFQDGFAIPHTQNEAIESPGIIILKSNKGIEWNSLDDKPAQFFIALLIPKEEAGNTHIRALASLSRMLIHEENRRELLRAGDETEILSKISEALEQ
ncbi:PTS sugar transporter subunit IIA [Sediminibacillus dalangtanensis]|uniref:PTS sugar transporter subunit IIA n=1 Tax=Sediminibacillus dalangtanensis TaxID=2729421 RepID=A0ABX7VQA8_9BACI|nr:fructose PTS transporter subunit IIA [Sediminibacillus dalangtanensis]QTM99122.1 PTS sugar transporter subunit IIA [Sediminibacillus dalangtanensis]